MGSLAASRPAPTLHGWAFLSCIVGLTLAVNLPACGQPAGLLSKSNRTDAQRNLQPAHT